MSCQAVRKLSILMFGVICISRPKHVCACARVIYLYCKYTIICVHMDENMCYSHSPKGGRQHPSASAISERRFRRPISPICNCQFKRPGNRLWPLNRASLKTTVLSLWGQYKCMHLLKFWKIFFYFNLFSACT